MSRDTAVAAIAIVTGFACVSCLHHMSEGRIAPGTAAGPGTLWTPPARAVPSPSPSPAPAGIPQEMLERAASLGLDDLIDLALRHNPDTRAAWSLARSAAAELGARRGEHYPTVVAQDSLGRVKGSAVGGRFTYYSTTTNPTVTLNWLLFDFGGRRASIEEARQALIAADWTHNQAILDVVLLVEQSYYQYLNGRTYETAAETTVREAETLLDAADRRHQAGLATIGDVLQARTAVSQARLALQTIEGDIQVTRGVLASSVGLPANTPFDIDKPEQEVPLDATTDAIERLIEQAQALRPDVAAARAEVQRSQAVLGQVKSFMLPSVSANANAGRITYSPDWNSQETYGVTLNITIPVFNGLTQQYNVLRAKADIETAQARLDSLVQQAIVQVWTSYYNQKTATGRVKTSRDLLESAAQAFDVTSARYKAGVGSILDVLTAERVLANARAQEAQSRTDWFLATAQLAHDTGTLWRVTPAAPPSAAPAPGAAPSGTPAPPGPPPTASTPGADE